MNLNRKLQLAGFQWFFVDEDFDGGCGELVENLIDTLSKLKEKEETKEKSDGR